MIRNLIVIAAALVIAFSGGAWLTAYSIQQSDQFGGITIGGWTAYPLAGTLEADPYAKARLARDAALALGAAEGVTLYADKDSQGAALFSRCDYTVEGKSPSARLWTIYALNTQKAKLTGIPDEWPSFLNSETIAYGAGGIFTINVSASARPNNWLAVSKASGFILALNLYDSPVATNKGLVETTLPTVTRGKCDG